MSEPCKPSSSHLNPSKPLLRRHATLSHWTSTIPGNKNLLALAKIATWIEKFVKIRPKDGPIELIKFNAIQEILLQYVAWCWYVGIPVRVATPKSRQLGSSTFWDALFYALCELIPGYNAAIVAHTDDGATELFGKITTVKKGLKTTDWDVSSLTSDQGSYLQWDSESALWCATIKTGDALGKAGTLSGIHFSEVANFSDKRNDADKAITSIVNSMAKSPRMFEVYESTAKGHDPVFYPLCEEARDKESGSTIQLIFLPWFLDPGYRMPWEEFRKELILTGKTDPGETFVPTKAEETLRKLLSKTKVAPHEVLYRYCHDLTDDQLIWRRWAIANKCGKIDKETTFKRYYPSFYEECWTASSTAAFDQDTIDHYRKTCKPPLWRGNLLRLPTKIVMEQDDNGPFRFWEEPQPGIEYVLGADVGGTTPRSDPHDAFVINKNSLEQVASLHGRFEEDDYAKHLFNLGTYYNVALMGVENNHSPVVANTIFKLGYTNLYCYFVAERHGAVEGKVPGWNTNKKTRPLMTAAIRRSCKSLRLVINDDTVWPQMPTFVWVPFPTAKNPEMEGDYRSTGANHDDKIIALSIAVYLCDPSAEDDDAPPNPQPVPTTSRAMEFFLSLSRQPNKARGVKLL